MPDQPVPPDEADSNTDDATIDAEERRQDDDTAREAVAEAEALGAVPYDLADEPDPRP